MGHPWRVHHSGDAVMTPEDVHCNHMEEVQRGCAQKLKRDRMSHSENYADGPPEPLILRNAPGLFDRQMAMMIRE